MIASVLRKLPATVIASCVSLSFIWLVPAEVSMMAAGWLVSGTLVGISLLAWALMVRLRLSGLTQSLAWGWGVAAILSATLGLWQFSGWGWEDTSWIASSPNHEVYANLRQKNHLATLLVMGVIILGWRIANGSRAKNLVEWLAMSLLLACLVATASRTGAVQFGALFIFLIARRSLLPHSLMRVAFGALMLYLVMLVLIPWLSGVLGHSNAGLLSRLDDHNAFSRIALWSNVWELIAQKPWRGHGWHSLAYAHYSAEFSGARFMEMLDNAHNLPLHLAVELGVPIALLFCGVMVWMVRRGKPWTETQPHRIMAWAILLVIGIHSLLEYPLWHGPFLATALICIGILYADFGQKWLLANTGGARNALVLGVGGLAALLLAFTTFAAFDYHRVSQIYLQPEKRSSWYAQDALDAAQKSRLFQSHAKFAELVITPLSQASAPRVLRLSSELVYWSPEPRVIEKLIESAVMMDMGDLAAFHLKRYRVAYPQAYKVWAAKNADQRAML